MAWDHEGRTAAPSSERRPIVLLAEDYDDSRTLYAAYLAGRGWRVVETGRGDEVLRLVRTRRPHIVVLDLALPGMDGWSLTSHLKSDPATSDIPVVIVSAHVLPSEKQQALDSGCDSFLDKPCLPNHLEQELRRLLSQHPAVPQ